MKNVYTKPVLVMESFTLSQSIAYGCGANLDPIYALSRDKYSCGWESGFPGDVYFIKGVVPACTVDDPKLKDLCYDNPEGGYAIFKS